MKNSDRLAQAVDPKDFSVSYHGSISIIRPLTERAKDWVREYIPADAQRWAGGIAVEHRYVDGVVTGIINDGLTVATH